MKGQVLIIDDNVVDVKIVSHAVERIGYSCHGFTDHTQALEWVQSNRPQYIFLDLQMPTITGFELIPVLKNMPHLKSTPILIISGKNNKEDVLRAIKAGAVDYVVKPLDPLVIQEKFKKTENDSEFFSLSIEEAKRISAYISKPTEILSISEFGLTLKSDHEMQNGTTIELTALPMDIFGSEKLLLRCLTCDFQAEAKTFLLQMTYVGMQEPQRQTIRKQCRQMWIQKKESA